MRSEKPAAQAVQTSTVLAPPLLPPVVLLLVLLLVTRVALQLVQAGWTLLQPFFFCSRLREPLAFAAAHSSTSAASSTAAALTLRPMGRAGVATRARDGWLSVPRCVLCETAAR